MSDELRDAARALIDLGLTCPPGCECIASRASCRLERALSASDDGMPYEPIADGYAEPDYWMRCADGYARVCAALGIAHPDGTPGDVDAVLGYLETRRAATEHLANAALHAHALLLREGLGDRIETRRLGGSISLARMQNSATRGCAKSPRKRAVRK